MALIRNKFFLFWEVCPRLPSNVCLSCSLLVTTEYSLIIMALLLPGEATQGDSVKGSWVVVSLWHCELSRSSGCGES